MLRHLFAECSAAPGACHHQASGDGDHERGNLRGKTVTNGQHSKGMTGLRQRPSLLQYAGRYTANNVDGSDDHSGNCITAHESTCAIHGAEEICFARKIIATFPRLGAINGTGC